MTNYNAIIVKKDVLGKIKEFESLNQYMDGDGRELLYSMYTEQISGVKWARMNVSFEIFGEYARFNGVEAKKSSREIGSSTKNLIEETGMAIVYKILEKYNLQGEVKDTLFIHSINEPKRYGNFITVIAENMAEENKNSLVKLLTIKTGMGNTKMPKSIWEYYKYDGGYGEDDEVTIFYSRELKKLVYKIESVSKKYLEMKKNGDLDNSNPFRKDHFFEDHHFLNEETLNSKMMTYYKDDENLYCCVDYDLEEYGQFNFFKIQDEKLFITPYPKKIHGEIEYMSLSECAEKGNEDAAKFMNSEGEYHLENAIAYSELLKRKKQNKYVKGQKIKYFYEDKYGRERRFKYGEVWEEEDEKGDVIILKYGSSAMKIERKNKNAILDAEKDFEELKEPKSYYYNSDFSLQIGGFVTGRMIAKIGVHVLIELYVSERRIMDKDVSMNVIKKESKLEYELKKSDIKDLKIKMMVPLYAHEEVKMSEMTEKEVSLIKKYNSDDMTHKEIFNRFLKFTIGDDLSCDLLSVLMEMEAQRYGIEKVLLDSFDIIAKETYTERAEYNKNRTKLIEKYKDSAKRALLML